MLDWQETDTGFRSGRYEVVGEGPYEWRLAVGGHDRGSHRTASSARTSAERMARERARMGRIGRLVALLGLVAVVAATAFAFRLGHNPVYDDAEALVAAMDTARIAVQGGAPIDEVASSLGIDGAIVTLPHGEEISALAGEVGDECYVHYWRADRAPKARVLADVLPCELGPVIVSFNESSYKRVSPVTSQHLTEATSLFDWHDVLPDEHAQRTWFLPVVLAAISAAMWLLIRTSLVVMGADTER